MSDTPAPVPYTLDRWNQHWEEGETGWQGPESGPVAPFAANVASVAKAVGTDPVVAGGTAFVPLCGDSAVVLYLAAAGMNVIALEGAKLAVEQLRKRVASAPEDVQKRVHVVDCDFFKFVPGSPEHLASEAAALTSCTFVYDRASFVAINPSLRADYAAVMDSWTAPGAHYFFEGIERQLAVRTEGPPFHTSNTDIAGFFPNWKVQIDESSVSDPETTKNPYPFVFFTAAMTKKDKPAPVPYTLDRWNQLWEKGDTRWQQMESGPVAPFAANVASVAKAVGTDPVVAGGTAFVPLCGDSAVVLYLAAAGMNVIALEGAKLAVEQLRKRVASAPEDVQKRVHVVDCDFFKFVPGSPEHLASEAAALTSCTFVYDRASFVAINPSLRADYAAVMDSWTAPGAHYFFEGVERQLAVRTEGPPFHTPNTDIAGFFPNWKVQIDESSVSDPETTKNPYPFVFFTAAMTKKDTPAPVPYTLDRWNQHWEEGETGWQGPESGPVAPFAANVASVAKAVGTDPVVAGGTAFVPLCGDSAVVLYLAAAGMNVIALEGAKLAVEQLRKRVASAPEDVQKRVHVVDCDFFKFVPGSPEHLASEAAALTSCTFVYDRASFVAINPSLRADYAAVMDSWTAPGAHYFFEGIERQLAVRTEGPPFHTSNTDIAGFFPNWKVQIDESSVSDPETTKNPYPFVFFTAAMTKKE